MVVQLGPGPFLQAVKMLAYGLHIGGGTLGLASGTVAAFAPKGRPVHRLAGTVFLVSMLVTATFAAYLAVVVPGQIVNLFIGAFTFYLVATAWMTVRPRDRAIRVSEKIALLIALGLCAPFVILAFQLAAGMAPFLNSAVPLRGPVLIAIYGFASVIVIAAIADARVVLADGLSGAPRLARHLWRMCLGLTLATGSFFTNALPRVLPPSVHFSPAFFLPQLAPLGLLIFWMIRVRFTGWWKQAPLAQSA